MAKIDKEPNFFYSVIVLLCIFITLFIVRVNYQKSHRKVEEKGYAYGALAPKTTLTRADTYLGLGDEALYEYRIDDAREIFLYGTKHFPENSKMWYGLYESYISNGDKEHAIMPLEKAAELAGNDPNLWYRLSTLYYLTGNFEKSKFAMEKAVALSPDNVGYQEEMARIYNLNGNYEESKKIYEKLLEKDPQNAELSFAYLKVSNWSKEKVVQREASILKNIEKDLDQNNEIQFQDALNEYRILFGETPAVQLILAEYTYKKYLQSQPKDADSWFQLANFYSKFNKPEKAEKTLQKALELKPKNLEYLRLAADLASELNKDAENIKILERMLEIDPTQEKLKIELALAIFSREDVNISATLIESNPLLLESVMALYGRNYVGALAALKAYETTAGPDPLFQSILALIALRLDKGAINGICCDADLIQLTKDLLETGGDIRDTAYMFQSVAKEVAQQAVCRDPCSVERLDLYGKTVRLFEEPPSTDFIVAQRIYSDILLADPCNYAALRNLAYVTALFGEIDAASDMYELYLRQIGLANADAETIIEYANVLESQGNNHMALKYMGYYSCHFEQNQDYFLTLQHQLNSADRPSPAYSIATCILEKDPCSYEGWLNYTRACALLHYPCASLYGLQQIQALQPANPLTLEAEWLVLIPLLSNVNGGGLFHQERVTGLTQWSQFANIACTLWPGFQLTAGASGFETSAALDEGTVIEGLGDLRQVNGEKWAGQYSAWVGFNRFFTRQFLGNFRIGAGHTDAANGLTTIEYGADLLFPICDNLIVNLDSFYGFYNYSPRNLSLYIRRWHNDLQIDWYANIDNHILSFWEVNLLTDGNQLYEITLYPRHTIYNTQFWKAEVGLYGNWLMARKEVQHGYYSPHLYQAYGVELLIDYVISDFSVIKLNNTVGMAKDTFNTRFGFLGNSQLRVEYNVTLFWYLEFIAEYFYLDSSLGYFDYMEFSGQITHRF